FAWRESNEGKPDSAASKRSASRYGRLFALALGPIAAPRALQQRRRGNHAGRDGDGDRMAEIHAVQLVAGGVQEGVHAAETQIHDLGNLLICFSFCSPDQTLLFAL